MVNRFWEKRVENAAVRGAVLRAEAGGLGVSGEVDAQNIELVHPYGVFAQPCEQDEVLLLPVRDGRYVMLGVISAPEALKAGELLLKGKSGAYLKLGSDGAVEINGLRIGSDGQIES